jgi:hypothetical protein
MNDVWKFEFEIEDTDEDPVTEYMDLNVKLDASNSIHILGEIKGSDIQLTSKLVMIKGTLEGTTN